MSAKPVTPEEVESNPNQIPDFVVEAVNGILNQKYDKCSKRAVIKRDDVITAILKTNPGVTEKEILANSETHRCWLDFEPIFEGAGWKVSYESPRYWEDFDAYYTFTKKRKK